MVTLTYSLVGVFKKMRSGLFGLPVERKVRKESEVPKPPPPPLPPQSYQRIINRLHFYFICAKFTEKDQMIAISWKP